MEGLRDPAGLVERVPELVELSQESPAVRRAIEKGKPHAVYRALLHFAWFKAKGRSRDVARELLSRRRLFLEPIASAPTLFTYNGCGFRIYGRADRDSDGTYVSTHYLTFVYVPLFPLRSYLTADGDTAKSYRFVGKVPGSLATYLWQRLVALAVVLSVAVASAHAIDDSLHGTLHVTNGLALPVHVELSGAPPVDVPGGREVPIRASAGRHHISVLLEGAPIETGDLDLPRGKTVSFWNVLGAALVFVENVSYAANATPDAASEEEPEVHCSAGFGSAEDVVDAFTESPRTISMSKDSGKVVRRRVDFMRTPNACVGYLSATGKTGPAAALARKIAEVGHYRLEDVNVALELLKRAGEEDAVVSLARAARDQNPTSVEFHRTYQSAMEATGKRRDLITEYRARMQQNPGSADSMYLLARVSEPEEEMSLLRTGLGVAPHHPYLLRAFGFRQMCDGRHQAAAEAFETLHRTDPVEFRDVALLDVQALAGLGQIDPARTVVREMLDVRDLPPMTREQLVIAALQLSSFEPRVATEEMVARVEPARRVAVLLDGGLDVSKEDLEHVTERAQRSAFEVALVAREQPASALDALAKLDGVVVRSLSGVQWGLLFGEAARIEPPHAVLSKLTEETPLDRVRTEALARFIRTGESSAEFVELPADLRAAIVLARSRRAGVTDTDRKALREQVKLLDPLRGPVTRAMNAWPG